MGKTNWTELIRNTGGKLSGSGFLGLLTGVVALTTFVWGTALVAKGDTNGIQVMTISAYVVTIAGTLLGIRRFTVDKNVKDGTI
jgi:hypothetical protein